MAIHFNQIPRRIALQVSTDLKSKMVFLSGPRQCGKTTLAKKLIQEIQGRYYNWDVIQDRKAILKNELDLDAKLWVFDEIHKSKNWRGFLKGAFDTYAQDHPILVTGSARLELYGRGGDSLQGRYYPHHLHPFTVSELSQLPFQSLDEIPLLPNKPTAESFDALSNLLTLGGFPEPFLSGSESQARRWRIAYDERLVREDISSLERLQELEKVELMLDRLGEVAGSVVSINSLREDLEISFDTAAKWLKILEKLFACFRISPFGPPKIKAVKKEQKLYLWDSAKLANQGARFENLIALHLIRLVDWTRDVEGVKLELRYFRLRSGPEVDFILLRDKKPWLAIEVKKQEQSLAPSLAYFLERVSVPYAFQVHLEGQKEKKLARIGQCEVRSVSAARFLANLP